MQAVVQDLLTTYTDTGKGSKTVLCVHGWGDSSKSFELLSKQLKDYRVVCVDLPGFGGSQMPNEPWGLNEYALFIADFVRKLDLKIYAIVGHSNGGAIAVKLLSLGYLQADRLVLLASSGIRRPGSFRNKALLVIAKSGKLVIHLAPEKTKHKLRTKFYNKIGSDYLVAGHMKETFKKVVSEDVLDCANNLEVKTCLIYGDQDLATPQIYGALFADAMYDARLHVLQGAGHFLHVDRPDEVGAIVGDFLA